MAATCPSSGGEDNGRVPTLAFTPAISMPNKAGMSPLQHAQDGHVLDILAQSRRTTQAAKRFLRKLLKDLHYAPRWS